MTLKLAKTSCSSRIYWQICVRMISIIVESGQGKNKSDSIFVPVCTQESPKLSYLFCCTSNSVTVSLSFSRRHPVPA